MVRTLKNPTHQFQKKIAVFFSHSIELETICRNHGILFNFPLFHCMNCACILLDFQQLFSSFCSVQVNVKLIDDHWLWTICEQVNKMDGDKEIFETRKRAFCNQTFDAIHFISFQMLSFQWSNSTVIKRVAFNRLEWTIDYHNRLRHVTFTMWISFIHSYILPCPFQFHFNSISIPIYLQAILLYEIWFWDSH